ncbi:hypothetical protein A3A64_04855 [Candidatus Gottesmanbacteria bacterium RIFCSPLOWO2_01_FULL_48_11]|uniref:Uncharacterized protein n=3 Tax=Candidatus Gottesmaniibacteriota TaxID=1752720 RepID=A0A0G1X0M5_9BACT|nr:MAG: hypothetical protein UT57_C0008G0013 [Microgenomates group bacterium GW2011_GWC1_39_7]KKU87189.1 MAG: hypothetical protein UY16_C0035G0003 [Candidatus Gottesmanbacteria bacterium GW2011_GWA2_47_9]KKU96098.1 MAG: hypothetical protein UY27_C0004G0028 [Candidatus Gottesmanbacteria bacterium GW2011_GWA1_48_13]OGG27828.1 MAG: hypothetical protein A3A64_04855 [Candidatus Gottesmanbacteria bacterium RIFCSPLOWO2_01_FULL_48_11]
MKLEENSPSITSDISISKSDGIDTPKKPLVRTTFVLCVLLFISLLGFSYFYLQAQSLKRQLDRIAAMPTPQPNYTYIEKPTPTMLVQNEINSSRQTVNLSVPKYLDSPQEKETYTISFDKVSSNTVYSITSDSFPKLIISDGTYEFSIQIPKEGQSNTFDKIPITELIRTNQFGNVTRIFNPSSLDESNLIRYFYVTDYSTNCTQWQPKPAACSSLQIYWNDKSQQNKQIGAYISCKSDASQALCDKLIATLGIGLENQ